MADALSRLRTMPGEASRGEKPLAVRPLPPRKGPLLFLPARVQRPALLKTLKRIHAWTGLWGAALFFLMGSSGILLNHRAVLPIDVGGPVAVSSVQLPVAPGAITSEAMLGAWAHRRLGLAAVVKPYPVPEAQSGARAVRFLDRRMIAAPSWQRMFYLPNQKVTVSYVPGSTVVTAKAEALGVLAVVKNLHKGVGLGVAWVLLIDTIAGALITMSITGFLLWSRLHGSRLLAGALAGGAILWALLGSVPFLQ